MQRLLFYPGTARSPCLKVIGWCDLSFWSKGLDSQVVKKTDLRTFQVVQKPAKLVKKNAILTALSVAFFFEGVLSELRKTSTLVVQHTPPKLLFTSIFLHSGYWSLISSFVTGVSQGKSFVEQTLFQGEIWRKIGAVTKPLKKWRSVLQVAKCPRNSCRLWKKWRTKFGSFSPPFPPKSPWNQDWCLGMCAWSVLLVPFSKASHVLQALWMFY